ncbi:hypothetical protein [Streptomyces sp. ME19-01-6]|uniref:hypothetical protein n=1 Tax=Streptomyces sp. ME19-01-6 TaxID=3028686 RepID=UPI0029AF2BEC|nr:hypothetical protein [Streptomyces sp. ME19-01-6]MDX3225050.1 hypothetical protein [Streptomyces sp. ME19-01-6]
MDTEEHRRLLEAFVAAAQRGGIASLEALLTPDAASPSDGNGIRGAARVPVLGRARVANLATACPRFWRGLDLRSVDAPTISLIDDSLRLTAAAQHPVGDIQ